MASSELTILHFSGKGVKQLVFVEEVLSITQAKNPDNVVIDLTFSALSAAVSPALGVSARKMRRP